MWGNLAKMMAVVLVFTTAWHLVAAALGVPADVRLFVSLAGGCVAGFVLADIWPPFDFK